MILTEALPARPAAEPLDTSGLRDPPSPLLGPYQCLRAAEGQRSKSAPTKGPGVGGGPLLPGPQIPKTAPPSPLPRERGRPHVGRRLPETPWAAGDGHGPRRVPNAHSESHDAAATSKIPLRELTQSLQRQPRLCPTPQPGGQPPFRQDLPPPHLPASPQLLGPCLQPARSPSLGSCHPGNWLPVGTWQAEPLSPIYPGQRKVGSEGAPPSPAPPHPPRGAPSPDRDHWTPAAGPGGRRAPRTPEHGGPGSEVVLGRGTRGTPRSRPPHPSSKATCEAPAPGPSQARRRGDRRGDRRGGRSPVAGVGVAREAGSPRGPAEPRGTLCTTARNPSRRRAASSECAERRAGAGPARLLPLGSGKPSAAPAGERRGPPAAAALGPPPPASVSPRLEPGPPARAAAPAPSGRMRSRLWGRGAGGWGRGSPTRGRRDPRQAGGSARRCPG